MLLVLGMRCAVEPEAERRGRMNDVNLTVVAVDALSRVTRVGVSLKVALGELEVLARDNGVQGEGGAGENFAGVAVAQDGVLAVGRILVSLSTEKSKKCEGYDSGRDGMGWLDILRELDDPLGFRDVSMILILYTPRRLESVAYSACSGSYVKSQYLSSDTRLISQGCDRRLTVQ